VSAGRRWPADFLALLTALTGVAAVVLAAGSGSHAALTGILSTSPFVLSFGGVGWVLARRLPRNAIGWCFSIGALFWVATELNDSWTEAALSQHTMGTAARIGAVVGSFGWIFAMPFSIQLPLLLLPDGRLLSRRWRPAVWLVATGFVLGALGFLTVPGEIQDPAYAGYVNPLGISALGGLPLLVGEVGAAMLLAAILLGAVALVLRFRRARGSQRQQLRWIALGGCGALLAVIANVVPGLPPIITGAGATVGIVAVPACVGVAVLRYRLYDLGRLVSRTVSYAVVTGTLVAVYVGLVTTVSTIRDKEDPLVVAASTLVVAALFQPLRRRVQKAVNHRFNRAGYDAERTVEDFSRRLRAEVDLEEVRADLLAVAYQTMQPATAAIWLRGSPPVAR